MNSSSRRTYSSPIRPSAYHIPDRSDPLPEVGPLLFQLVMKSSHVPPSFTGMLPDYCFAFQQGGILFHFVYRRDSAVPECHQIFSLRDQRVFLSDNLPVPEELSYDWIFSSIIRRRALNSSSAPAIIVFSCDTASFSFRSWISCTGSHRFSPRI